MRKFIANIFATTGISFILLSTVALFFHAKCIYLQTVFQVLSTNTVLHFGVMILSKLEMKCAIIEAVLEIALIIITLIVFGSIFHWFTSTPIWILVIMGFAIYIVSVTLNSLCLKQEAQEINALIKRRNGKKNQQT
ncbi:hypothetical protein AALA99_05750 [Anaerotruncus colihominis]|uniref:hypothetical protein n=1 Tax=Anaerotruncus colihominis TaxID=169435 RepID=UPI003512439D